MLCTITYNMTNVAQRTLLISMMRMRQLTLTVLLVQFKYTPPKFGQNKCLDLTQAKFE
jgi:hypothetical protein